MKNKFKAFTLIELLVVIAIIGILSSIVIVNLNSARGKGQDAAVKQQMSQIRSAAILYEDTTNGFSTGNITPGTAAAAATCSTASTVFTDGSIANAIKGVGNNAGSAPNCVLGTESGALGVAQSWAMISSLRTASNSVAVFWCVDSSGKTNTVANKTTISSSGNDVVCP